MASDGVTLYVEAHGEAREEGRPQLVGWNLGLRGEGEGQAN